MYNGPALSEDAKRRPVFIINASMIGNYDHQYFLPAHLVLYLH